MIKTFFSTNEVGQRSRVELLSRLGTPIQSNIIIGAVGQRKYSLFMARFSCDDEVSQSAADTYLDGLPIQILLVEDDAAVRELSARILRWHGFKVIEADNGEQALHSLVDQSITIDLLLTDIVMPQMSGEALALQLIARFPDLKVLFTSGYSNDILRRPDKWTLDISFLPKPFTPSSLVERVREILNQT
ncbi:MAG: response regulator [Anaerolineaceae bacterium]|nr:response regulator [Anaerolineaceae bacterium]MCB9098983.1 response regulator [Anaerolineales bacterium]